MPMIKRGTSVKSTIVECELGNDMTKCPHCEKFISLKSSTDGEGLCKYCGKSVVNLTNPE